MDSTSSLGPTASATVPSGAVDNPDVTPLTEAPVRLEPPSSFERICRFVPLVGWTVAGTLERERRAPKWKHIANQLAARTKRTTAAWGDNPTRRSIASAISKVIRD